MFLILNNAWVGKFWFWLYQKLRDKADNSTHNELDPLEVFLWRMAWLLILPKDASSAYQKQWFTAEQQLLNDRLFDTEKN